MKTTKNIAIAVASAALFSFPALAAGRAPAAVDYSAAYGDPTWPASAARLPGIALDGSGDSDSALRRDPTWPDATTLAPAVALDTYVADRPLSSIVNDGPSFALRSYARLDAQAGGVGAAQR